MTFGLDRRIGNWPALFATIIVATLVLLYQNYSARQADIAAQKLRDAEPIEGWLEISSIYVPDHALDEDAMVIYDRKIYKSFTGIWTAEVEPVPVDKNPNFLCRTSGANDYTPDFKLPPGGVSLENKIFENIKCPWEPGDYILKTSWMIHRPGYDMRVVRQNSNVFHVRPPGTQSYVTQEQVQQLEDAKKLLENSIPVK